MGTSSRVFGDKRENDGLEDKMCSLADRVGSLELSLNPGQKTEGEDVLVSFMGVRFGLEQDVKTYIESMSGGKFFVPAGLVTDCYTIFHTLNQEILDTNKRLSMVDLASWLSSLGAKQADVCHMLAAPEHGLPEFFDSRTS